MPKSRTRKVFDRNSTVRVFQNRAEKIAVKKMRIIIYFIFHNGEDIAWETIVSYRFVAKEEKGVRDSIV